MRAKDVMARPVVTVGPGTAVHRAAQLLSEHGHTALPVVDGDGDLVGIVTEADVVRGRVLPDPRGRRTRTAAPPRTVGEVMTTDVVTVDAGTDLADVARTMLDRKLRAIPVTDTGQLVGILTRGDLVRCVARDDRLVAADVRHRLDRYSGPGHWEVTACAGEVTIIPAADHLDPADQRAAEALATAVPGVSSVWVS